MKLEEQYTRLINLKREVNAQLVDLNFDKIKELLLYLAGNQDYLKLKNKDNQLKALEFSKGVWLDERKYINEFEMQGDAFWGVNSLQDLESRYLKAHFSMLRLENDISEETCMQSVQELIVEKYSALFLFSVIVRETEMIEKNIFKLGRMLKRQNDLVRSIGVLKLGVEKYPKNDELILELADCWITVQQYAIAYEYLKKIENPDKEVVELLIELEKVLKNE